MNFQAECTKSLVRNTKQSLQKVSVTTKQSQSSNESSKKSKQIMPAVQKNELNLALPSINSSKDLVKKIKQIENVKNDISNNTNITKKVAVQEKITKQMNFHYNQPIYKDLIQIYTKTTKQVPQPSRNPLPLKDKEPKLEDFTKLKVFSEYSYKPITSPKLKKPVKEYDGFKMYRFSQKNFLLK